MKDYLEDWYEQIRMYKWRTSSHYGFLDHHVIESIYKSFRLFFSKEHLDKESESNWLKKLLKQNTPDRISQLAELSTVIEFYFELREKGDVLTDYSTLPINEIRNRFFELFVGLLFYKNGVNPQFDDVYSVLNTTHNIIVQKPIDVSFILENKKYIVECQKLYNTNSTSILDIAKDVIKKILFLHDDLRLLQIDVIPHGYIYFKQTKNVTEIASSIRNNLLKNYRTYLGGMGSNLDILNPVFEFEDDNYKVHIESSLFARTKEFEKEIEEYGLALMFSFEVINSQLQVGRFNVTAKSSYTSSDITEIICEKIRRKVKQHKKADNHVIIFIELEDNKVVDNSVSLFIDRKSLNYDRIRNALSKNFSAVLFFKEYNNFHCTYSTVYVCNDNVDNELKAFFNSIKLDILN